MFLMVKKASSIVTAEDRLHAAGLVFQRLEDVPPERVRAVNRFGFQDMRTVLLPPQIILSSLKQPLLSDLLITRVGYATRLYGHYIPRPEGSLDHILLFCPRGSGWLKTNGREWKAGPGTMCCLPAREPHWYGADDQDPWSNYWIHFTGRQAADYFRFMGVTSDHPLLHFSEHEELVADFEAIWSAMRLVYTWENLVKATIRLVRFLGLLREIQQRPDQRTQAARRPWRSRSDSWRSTCRPKYRSRNWPTWPRCRLPATRWNSAAATAVHPWST